MAGHLVVRGGGYLAMSQLTTLHFITYSMVEVALNSGLCQEKTYTDVRLHISDTAVCGRLWVYFIYFICFIVYCVQWRSSVVLMLEVGVVIVSGRHKYVPWVDTCIYVQYTTTYLTPIKSDTRKVHHAPISATPANVL
jgi:hypothetical protein